MIGAWSDRIPGRLGGVCPPGRSSPGEGPVGALFDLPPRLLLEPMIVPALRARVAQAGLAARLVRDIVLEVALARGPTADRASTSGMPDLGQVPELDTGIVTIGLEPVIAGLSSERVELDDQVRSVSGGAQPPGPVPARRSLPPFGDEAEPWAIPGPAWWPRFLPSLTTLGCGAGASGK